MNNIQSMDLHPSVVAVRARGPGSQPAPLSGEVLRALALECGADDAAVVSVDHPDLAEERPFILSAWPQARSLVSLMVRTRQENLRSPQRSLANHEFHLRGHEVDEVGRRLSDAIAARGHGALHPPMAFPMAMETFPGRTWVVSHKRVAVAAQLGRMGLHRSVIHPRFGSFILLGTVFTSIELEAPAAPPLTFDPCVSCKLCVAACPVGAIEPGGGFRFSACYDHNYREFMTGFSDVLEEVAESEGRHELRERVPLPELVSTWQSLAYKPNYKAAYCIAVCPAGDDVLGQFVDRRPAFLREVLRPLTERVETVYVVENSDAEAHVRARFPHKRVQRVRSSLRPTEPHRFFQGLPHTFQRGPARGWRGVFHFELSGPREVRATVVIDDGTLEVREGVHEGVADLTVRCDGALWLDVVSGRRSGVVAVLRRRLKTRGDRSLLARFAACFPR